MPLGGITVAFNEAAPANTDSAGNGDDEIRSYKTNMRGALDSEHNFPAAGGANTGYHRYGSARPFVEPASRVSSTGTDGRLIFNSTDSTFWNSGAGAASLIGGPGVLMVPQTVAPSQYSGPPNKHYTLIQYGLFVHDGTSSFSNVTFASAYSGAPAVFLTLRASTNHMAIQMTATNASGFSARAVSTESGAPLGALAPIFWASIGTAYSGVA